MAARVAMTAAAGAWLSQRLAKGSTTPVNTMKISNTTPSQRSKLPRIAQANAVTSAAASGGITTRR